MKKAFALLGLVLSVSTFVTSPVPAKDWSEIRIATEGAYPPWNFTAPSGQLDGYDVDVAKALCERMKATCTIESQDWDGMLPALNSGKFDAIVAAMAPTDERRKVVDFSRQYALGPRSFAALKGSDLAKIATEDKLYDLKKAPSDSQAAIDRLKPLLAGKVIGIQSSTTHAEFMDTYLKGAAEIREYKTTDQILLDLDAGRIDATFDDLTYLMSQTGTDAGKNLVFFGPHFDGGLLGDGSAIPTRKSDPDLRTKLDAAIESLMADGTLSKLSLKWFKIDVAPKPQQ